MQYKSVSFKWGFLFILLIGLIQCSNPDTDEINPVMMNGKPRFIIGNYHNPQDSGELKI